MSLATFKKKSVVNNGGTNRSGKPPGGYWLPQGPFGRDTIGLAQSINTFGPVGFSLNGGHRNVGGVGKESKFSRNGTPFRGQYARGTGGTFGKYPRPEPVFNVNRVITLGTQYLYVKPSVLSTYGQLRKQYRWAYNGKYPNYWVQPVLSNGTQSDAASQGVYLHNLTASNSRYINVNDTQKYATYIKCCNKNGTVCRSTPENSTFNDMARTGLYTKELGIPIISSEYTTYIQRRCINQTPAQKPFPYAVQTGTGMSASGTSVRRFGSSCGTSNVYLTPPSWYANSPKK